MRDGHCATYKKKIKIKGKVKKGKKEKKMEWERGKAR